MAVLNKLDRNTEVVAA